MAKAKATRAVRQYVRHSSVGDAMGVGLSILSSIAAYGRDKGLE
jgi:hypothetical protein